MGIFGFRRFRRWMGLRMEYVGEMGERFDLVKFGGILVEG